MHAISTARLMINHLPDQIKIKLNLMRVKTAMQDYEKVGPPDANRTWETAN